MQARFLARCVGLAVPVVNAGPHPIPLSAKSTAGLPAFNTSPGPNGGTTYSLSVQTDAAAYHAVVPAGHAA